MSLTLWARRVLRYLPRLAPYVVNWLPGSAVKPLTFAELARQRVAAGGPNRSPCSCAACRHARESVAYATRGGA